MSFPKKGNSIPKRGQVGRPSGTGASPRASAFMTSIASALHRELGSTHAAVKTAAGWTDTNERTVKNWFSGRSAPCGHHLVALLGRSDEVLRTVLTLAGREEMVVVKQLAEMRADLCGMLATMDRILRASCDPDIQKGMSNSG